MKEGFLNNHLSVVLYIVVSKNTVIMGDESDWFKTNID